MMETRERYITKIRGKYRHINIAEQPEIVTRWMRRAVLLSDTLRSLGCGDEAARIMRMSAEECEMEIKRRVEG